MTTIDSDRLRAVTGGQAADSDYPNMRNVHLNGVHDSMDTPVSDFTCWDSKVDPDYSLCAPTSQVNSARPYGSWYLPKKFIEERSK